MTEPTAGASVDAAAAAFWKRDVFGSIGSTPIERFTFGDSDATLATGGGLRVSFITLGATCVSVRHFDGRSSAGTEVTLGFDTVEEYLADTSYIGATVGRFANRIRGATFTLPASTIEAPQQHFTVDANENGANCLHGGRGGFHRRVWKVESAEEARTDREVGVDFSLESPDGDQGFPGHLRVTASFRVQLGKGTLSMRYRAEVLGGAASGVAIPVSITNHNYWNLSGRFETRSVEAHSLRLQSGLYLASASPTDPTPTGAVLPLAGGPFELAGKGNGANIGALNTAYEAAGAAAGAVHPTVGIDHCFAVAGAVGALREAACLSSAVAGSDGSATRTARVYTTLPAVQVYAGSHLPSLQKPTSLPATASDAGERTGCYRSAVCVETQAFPDAPNHAHLGTAAFTSPQSPWDHTTTWVFASSSSR